MARSLRPSISATTKPEKTDVGYTENQPCFIQNPHVVISRQRPLITYAVPNAVAMAISLTCMISAISAFCRLTTQISLYKQSPSRYLSHKASYSNFSPNWLPWQGPLDPQYQICLHWIAGIRKPTHRIKQRVASYHTAEVISSQNLPAPTLAHTPREQPISEMGGPPPCLVWTSSPSHRLTVLF